MRKIVHISDVHFGKIDYSCIEPLYKTIDEIKPNLVIASGDFTQRARVKEYREAKLFLDKIGYPLLVIPGNHDIRPLYSPLARIFSPYDRYRKYINEIIEPVHIDNEIAVAGLNTVCSSAIKDGRVYSRQIARLKNWFSNLGKNVIRIVVTHHPLDLPKELPAWKLARKAGDAVYELSQSGIDLYLSGHYHQSSVASTGERYDLGRYDAIASQAGTISDRRRSERQSFNLITINAPQITIETYHWQPGKSVFDKTSEKRFVKVGKEWHERKA